MINDIHTQFKAEFKCSDGHFVRSKSEMLIDNFFYQKGIMHAYEVSVHLPNNLDEDMYCDWYLPKYDTYIEFFGKLDDSKYLERAKRKIQLYEQNALNLLCLSDEDIKRLDKAMTEHIEVIKSMQNRKPFSRVMHNELFLTLSCRS